MKKTIICKERKIKTKGRYWAFDSIYFVVTYDDYSVKEAGTYSYNSESLAHAIDRTFIYDSLDDEIELDVYFESDITTEAELREQILKTGFTNLILNIKPLDESPNKQIADRVRTKIKETEESEDAHAWMDTFSGSRRLYEEQIL